VPVLEAAAEQKPKAAQPHIELARAYLIEKKASAARDEAVTATKNSPDSWVAWNTLGRAELALGELDKAKDTFNEAVDLGGSPYAWNNLGFTLLQQGKNQEAVDALENATYSDDPDDDGRGEYAEGYMWKNLAVAYERVDRLAEAEMAYENAVHSGDKSAKKPLALLRKKLHSAARR
jgi:Flp pilus assembly protein TadD